MDTKAICEAVRGQPFVPFTLRMNDGREFYVPHPEFILVARRWIVVNDEKSQAPIMLEPNLIASMQPGELPAGQQNMAK